MTSRAWLTQSVGIGDGLGNKYRFGKGKKGKKGKLLGKSFGKMVYTPDGMTYGTGHNVIMQPAFEGSVITLNKAGQIQITKQPN